MRTKNLLLMLSVFWLGLNGVPISTNGMIISLMVILITYAISQYLNIIPRTNKLKYNFLIYLLWLYCEILKSTFEVIKRIWSKIPNMQSTFKWINLGSTNNTTITVYSNSITLTPGTLVLDIDKKNHIFLIHALDASLIDDIETKIMLNKIKKTII